MALIVHDEVMDEDKVLDGDAVAEPDQEAVEMCDRVLDTVRLCVEEAVRVLVAENEAVTDPLEDLVGESDFVAVLEMLKVVLTVSVPLCVEVLVYL